MTVLHEHDKARCPALTESQVRASENYTKGALIPSYVDNVVTRLLQYRQADPSLARANLRRQITAHLEGAGLKDIPEHVFRSIEDRITAEMYGSTNEADINGVQKFIEQLNRFGITHMCSTQDGQVDAIYWADPELIKRRDDIDTACILVHDTSFGILQPKCGYDKFSVLATMERGGRSQILICGASRTDHSEYFKVMLRLLKQEYPRLAEKMDLVMFSDEDQAFLNATRTELPLARQYICLWHKKRNFIKQRASKAETSSKAKRTKPTVASDTQGASDSQVAFDTQADE